MKKITIDQYERAKQEIRLMQRDIALYEDRKDFIRRINEETQLYLEGLPFYKFQINKEKKVVFFSAIYEGSLITGAASCLPYDDFDIDIGRYIALCRALNVRYDKEELYRYIEIALHPSIPLHDAPQAVIDNVECSTEFLSLPRKKNRERIKRELTEKMAGV